MKSTQVEAFVKSHWEYLTVNDMAEELDITPSTISLTCKKLGVKAVSKKQQHINYVIDMCTKKTLPQIANKLGLEESYLKLIYNDIGIAEMPEGLEAKDEFLLSVATILSRYHLRSDQQTFLTDPRYSRDYD